MNLFYSANINDNEAILDEDEFRHCCKVLRHRVGDIIHITNGTGILAEAKISEIKKQEAILEIRSIETHSGNKNPFVIAIAPPKNRSRWEWFLEKSVEVGVDKIMPFVGYHSEMVKINSERSRKIIRSASLQSLRYHHPEITEIQPLNNLVASYNSLEFNKLIATYNPANKHIIEIKFQPLPTIILIGPEGDFSASEIEICNKAGFISINISQNRLRTETAGVIAINLAINAAQKQI